LPVNPDTATGKLTPAGLLSGGATGNPVGTHVVTAEHVGLGLAEGVGVGVEIPAGTTNC